MSQNEINQIKQLKKENRALRKYLRQIRDIPEQGDFDCGLNIPEDKCPVIDCGICLATFALKKNRPGFRKWRLV